MEEDSITGQVLPCFFRVSSRVEVKPKFIELFPMQDIQADRYASAILLRYPLHFPPDHTVHDGRSALDDSENLGAHVLIGAIGGGTSLVAVFVHGYCHIHCLQDLFVGNAVTKLCGLCVSSARHYTESSSSWRIYNYLLCN
jgi:hypothetical protein